MLPFSKTIQWESIQSFHLNQDSLIKWSIFQIIPHMYNFENRFIEYKFKKKNQKFLKYNLELENPKSLYWVNHYPLRILTFSRENRIYFYNSADFNHFFKIETKYKNQKYISTYKTSPDYKNKELFIEKIR